MSINKKVKFFYTLLCILTSIFAVVDHNPLNNGTTLSRNAGGSSFEGPIHNPALLGVERPPAGGMTLPGGMLGIGVWSDKFALSPFNKYWCDSAREVSALLTKIMGNSFGLKGLSPDEVSDRLTEELRNGATFYAGYKQSLLNFGWKYVGFDITTHLDEELKIPGGPFLLIFSRDEGLLPGNTLDLSTFRQDAIWATDVTFSLGLPVNIPALHDIFKLKFGAGGVGVKYVMGHSALRATTKSGKVYYNEFTNSLEVDGEITVRTAGTGFSGPWRWDNIFAEKGLPISGHGIGADIGGILYDENGSLTINFSNIGVIFWVNDVKEVTYKIKKEDLDIYDIISGIEEADKDSGDPTLYIFNRNKNEYISNEADTLRESSGFVSWLPVTLNIGYSYRWDFSKVKPWGLRILADYAVAAVNYEQALAKSAGRSFFPRISLGGEAGVLGGFLPIRLGYVFGGAEKLASAFGVGINLRYFSINASYKAVGSPIFLPRRGVEVAASVNVNWGMSTDKDKDGIRDRDDKCPIDPEDKDGFEDEDGCPELDN
ncbi:MAG: DUF5723 family protein, partial [Chitinispirillaceae bacterium]|nr:DUF5723 family protein [Chitinispirillaceae bacterium]